MIHFTTFFALMVGGMEVIQPAAALAGLSPRINLGLINTFQRRQGTAPPVPPQCATTCNPVNNIISGLQSCSPSVCCVASFETSYFNCFTCVGAAVNVTDFTKAQSTIDELYDDCALLGIQLPVLTFPGQNPNRPLSSVVLPKSTVTSIASLPPQSITQSTSGPSTPTPTNIASTTTSSQITVSSVNTASTPTPSSSSLASSGIRSAEMNCFNLITVAMMLGTWLYFAA